MATAAGPHLLPFAAALSLLKEIQPRMTRVAILRDPTIAAGIGQLGAMQSAAPSFGVDYSQ
jgi:hypothetical protein